MAAYRVRRHIQAAAARVRNWAGEEIPTPWLILVVAVLVLAIPLGSFLAAVRLLALGLCKRAVRPSMAQEFTLLLLQALTIL